MEPSVRPFFCIFFVVVVAAAAAAAVVVVVVSFRLFFCFFIVSFLLRRWPAWPPGAGPMLMDPVAAVIQTIGFSFRRVCFFSIIFLFHRVFPHLDLLFCCCCCCCCRRRRFYRVRLGSVIDRFAKSIDQICGVTEFFFIVFFFASWVSVVDHGGCPLRLSTLEPSFCVDVALIPQ